MIVPMKKVHVVVRQKDVPMTVEGLQELGIVHVEHQEELSGYQLEERRGEIRDLEQAIRILADLKPARPVVERPAIDWTDMVYDILELAAKIEHYKETIAKRTSLMRQWEKWGDFSPEDCKLLAGRGIYIQLCAFPSSAKVQLPQGVIIKKIYTSSGTDYVLMIAPEKIEPPCEVISLPPMSLGQMRIAQEEDYRQMSEAKEKIAHYDGCRNALQRILSERQNILRFEEVERGMRTEGDLALLKGYCPSDACSAITAKAKEQQWGLLVEDPSPEDQVPTLLRNPKGIGLINPVFDFMSIIPGYREADVSFCFLFFFSIFFGILIGDAGYGLIFLTATFLLHQKFKNKVTDHAPFYLIYVLSGCAMAWGFLTGTFFGLSLLGKFVKPIVPWLGNEDHVKLLCFIIGAVHLTIAHVWRGLRKLPSILILSDIGWIAIVWGAFFYAQQFILDKPIPSFVNPMGYIAFVVIVLFSQTFQDILKDVTGFMIGVMLTVLSVVSTLIDIISYIRLFAVGTAGVTLAEAFNQMALGVGFHNLFLGLGAVLILVLGHLLNVILGILAIMVHGLRLNILEFSGHLSLEWSGVQYSPFRRMR